MAGRDPVLDKGAQHFQGTEHAKRPIVATTIRHAVQMRANQDGREVQDRAQGRVAKTLAAASRRTSRPSAAQSAMSRARVA